MKKITKIFLPLGVLLGISANLSAAPELFDCFLITGQGHQVEVSVPLVAAYVLEDAGWTCEEVPFIPPVS